jgi:hypothetical protein
MNLIARSRSASFTFRTGQRSGVWFVTKNDVFYGDYLTRGQAVEAACFGARAVEAQGGSAQVLAMPGEVLITHRLPSLQGRTAPATNPKTKDDSQ